MNRAIASLRPFALAIGLLLLWIAAGAFGWIDSMVLPPLPEVLRSYGEDTVAVELWLGLGASLGRLLSGALIGIVVGLGLGATMGFSRRVEALIAPSFHGFRQIALFAWMPLITAWLGAENAAKITFIALATMKPVTMAAMEGVRSVPHQYLDVGRALCLSRWRTVRQVMLPSALPSIAAGLQLGVMHGWTAAIGAEYLLGSFAAGIGSFVVEGRERLAMAHVFAGVIAIAAVGLLLNVALRRVATRAMLWKGLD